MTQKSIGAFVRAFIVAYFSKRPKLEAKYTITNYNDNRLAKGLADGHNGPNPLVNFPDFSSLDLDKVWIYNVSAQDHYADTSIRKGMKFPGKQKGKKYAVVTSIPVVITTPRPDIDGDDPVRAVYEDGRRVAMDMINPANLGLDQEVENNSGDISEGRNLGIRGVFWSTHNPPLEKEIVAARKRMKKRYIMLLEQAQAIIVSKGSILELVTPELHAAADYYKITTPWHPVLHSTLTQEKQ